MSQYASVVKFQNGTADLAEMDKELRQRRYLAACDGGVGGCSAKY